MTRKKYADSGSEAEQSLCVLDALAAEKDGQRNTAGRLVACYPGIHTPAIPADWNRAEARAMLTNLVPLDTWFTLAEAADYCHFVTEPAATMRTLIERLSWYGWRWKSGSVVYALETSIQHKGAVRLDHVVATPGGSLVIGFIRITIESP